MQANRGRVGGGNTVLAWWLTSWLGAQSPIQMNYLRPLCVNVLVRLHKGLELWSNVLGTSFSLPLIKKFLA